MLDWLSPLTAEHSQHPLNYSIDPLFVFDLSFLISLLFQAKLSKELQNKGIICNGVICKHIIYGCEGINFHSNNVCSLVWPSFETNSMVIYSRFRFFFFLYEVSSVSSATSRLQYIYYNSIHWLSWFQNWKRTKHLHKYFFFLKLYLSFIKSQN